MDNYHTNELQTCLNLAEDYLTQENWLEAMSCYEQASQIEPDNPHIYQKLGDTLVKLGKWARAVKAYKNAQKLNPKLPLINRKLGQALQKQALATKENLLTSHLQAIKQFPHKLIHYYKALEFQPSNIDLYLGLAQALSNNHKFDEAIVICQVALLLEPNSGIINHQLEEIFTYKDSLKYDWKEEFNLGNSLFEQGKQKKSLKHYRRVLKLKPNIASIYHRLANHLLKLEAWPELVDCYQQLIKIQPSQAQNHHNLGDAFLNLDKWQDAAKCYRQAIKLNPDFSWSYHNLGDVLLKLEKWEQAAKNYRQAIKLNPDFPWSHHNLAEALFNLKQWEQAINSYNQALRLQPDLPYVNRKLAFAFHQQGLNYFQQSLTYYEQLIAESPTDLELYHQLNELRRLLNRKDKLVPQTVFPTTIDREIYALWWEAHAPSFNELKIFKEKINTLNYQPLLSIIVPVYNTPQNFLEEMIESVLAQVYPNWELCIADDNSSENYIKDILKEYSMKDERIKVIFREENGHISACSNSALSLANGEFICLLDHDDLLTPNALGEVVKLLNENPQADMIYSDEDKINDDGELFDPYFKPDWCPDSFLARMYTCHFGVYRHSLIKEIGGFRLGYEGSQDYDLVLRLTEKTSNICHIPKILYHWRSHSNSAAGDIEAKPYAYEAALKSLEEALLRREEKGTIIPHNKIKGVYTIRYEIKDYKLVSIIIPTRNLGDVLNRCLESIFSQTTYPNYEVIIVDNGTDEPETMAIFNNWEKREPKRFSCHRLDIPFNYSRLNNYGASIAQGDYLLFLNNDTEVINSDWLEAMVEQSQRESIGAVGATLLYPDDSIQHAGVILGIGGVAGHSHKYFPLGHQGYIRHLISINNYSAVTAACLMCRHEVFNQVHGFDETLEVAFNDVDFCLKIKEKGYHNICLPHVNLYHFESKSRGFEDTPEKQKRFKKEIDIMLNKWDYIINNDPCYNPNLTKKREDYSLDLDTRIELIDISLIKINTDKLAGFSLDSPKQCIWECQPLLFSGWIVGRYLPVTHVEIVHNEVIIADTLVNNIRPDVAEIFPDISEANKSGFCLSFSQIFQLPNQADLLVRGVFSDNSFISLAKLSLSYEIVES